jgi:UDP-N-acetylmuramoylalanine--D-glutamate ligase
MQIRKATIRESLSSFQGVEHRLEKVLKIKMYNISMIQSD